MSTRLRIVFKRPGASTLTGNMAVLHFAHALKPNNFKDILKKEPGANRLERLLSAAKRLPPGYESIFIREPKNTRKGRSLYWKEVAKWR